MDGSDQDIETAIPLSRARRGDRVEVVRVEGGWRVRQRLNQIGIYEGDVLRVTRRAVFGGPIAVEANGSETAIGRGIARHVVVRRRA